MPNGSVLITGCSTGIGHACAKHLSRHGYRVFAGVRKQGDADALIEESSGRVTPIILDVTNADQIRDAAKFIEKASDGDGLAGLVNNAGIPVAGPLEFVPLDELRKVFEVNVIGQIAVTQAMLPMLRTAKGRVINMGSIGGRVSFAFMGPYNASKFAMEALTDSLRPELAPWGIRVSIIEPGNIATNIWQRGIDTGLETRSQLPAEAETLYGEQFDDLVSGARFMDRSGISADHVAKAVLHAMTARRPKTRYLVGKDARAQSMLAPLPDRLRDKLLGKALANIAKRGRTIV